MSRSEGFTIANIDVGLLSDDKFKRLRRESPQDAEHIIVVYVALLLECWAHGKRLTVEEAAPEWLELRPEILRLMVGVKLLDRQHRVTAPAWAKHFGPALARREAARAAGRAGGQASAQARSDRQPSVNHSSTVAQPPLNLTDRTDLLTDRGVRHSRKTSTNQPRGRMLARGGPMERFDEAMRQAGFNPERLDRSSEK